MNLQGVETISPLCHRDRRLKEGQHFAQEHAAGKQQHQKSSSPGFSDAAEQSGGKEIRGCSNLTLSDANLFSPKGIPVPRRNRVDKDRSEVTLGKRARASTLNSVG